MFFGNALGQLLPAHVFYKSEFLWITWMEAEENGARVQERVLSTVVEVLKEFSSVDVPTKRYKK